MDLIRSMGYANPYMQESSVRPRWWPVYLIVIFAVVLVATAWLAASDSSERIRQEKVMMTAVVLLLASFLLLLWVVFFSRLPGRSRVFLGGGFFSLIVVFFALFEYRGVSGDLVPWFELRFRSSAANLTSDNLASLPGAADFPQFLGPSRNGEIEGVRLSRDFTAEPPKLLWRRPVGRGWSGFSVSGNAALTQEQHSAEERVVRYELSTGQVEWATREVAHYQNALAGEGPRATPTIHGGRVYAMGGTGLLTAIELDSGATLWKRDVIRDVASGVPVWGKSDSPLVLDGRVIVAGGKSATLVAYDAENGEEIWRVGDDGAGYASPIVATLAGVEQIVAFNGASLTGHDIQTGRVLWTQAWPRRQPNVAQPLLLPGDRLLASSGYGVGAKLFRVDKHSNDLNDANATFVAELVWESLRLKSKFANFIYYDGFVYGIDDGIMVCIDLENGRRKWKAGRYGHGQLLLVRARGEDDGLLIVQGEHGEIILVEPSPDELRELTRFRALDGKIWNPPTLAGRYLLVRNDAEAALFELPVTTKLSAR